MPNTRQSAKRISQTSKKTEKNRLIKGYAKACLKKALIAIKNKDSKTAGAAYLAAVSALDKAAAKRALPKTRASRKIARLTKIAQNDFPEALQKSAN